MINLCMHFTVPKEGTYIVHVQLYMYSMNQVDWIGTCNVCVCVCVCMGGGGGGWAWVCFCVHGFYILYSHCTFSHTTNYYTLHHMYVG